MKIHLLIIGLLFFLLQQVQAQKEGSIQGIVKDSSSGLPLEGATVTVLLVKDSSLVGFSRTNGNGFFSIRNIDNGSYRLLITHVGYLNISRSFAVTASLPGIDFGVLFINNKSTLLKEVTVTQEKPPVVIRNDTLEYNAGSFKTKPNAVVEDLLKKLPGVQVDGKAFSGNDPGIAAEYEQKIFEQFSVCRMATGTILKAMVLA